ncbi:tail fiber protein, partial [Photorhabdus sp. APURE]|uniref:phage tail protein n=1 Tax=Photorhabdus aballayi TaxID=2991723 RepID=UPI00223CDC01
SALPRESAWSFKSGAHTISTDSNYATLILESSSEMRRTIIQTQPRTAAEMLVISYEDKSIYIPRKDGTLATLDDVNAANNIPVGSPIPWPLPNTPAGYLACNGQSFNKSLYPQLATSYPSGRLPDLRGEFIRGWDDSRGVDPGRVCGTWQEGAYLVQETNNPLDNVVNFSLNNRAALNWDIPHSSNVQVRARSVFDNTSTWTTEAKFIGVTRPRNVAFN